MDLKEVLSYWKLIVTSVIVIVGATISVISWAEDQKTLIKAEQSLIHNEQYQVQRVTVKRDQISDNLKMIRLLRSDDDELSLQEQKFVESLEEENVRLQQEIERIETSIHTEDE